LAHILIGEPVPTPDQVRGRLSPEYALALAPTHRRRVPHAIGSLTVRNVAARIRSACRSWRA